MKGQDGKEMQCVEIVRTKTKSAVPAASTGEAKAPSDAHARLLEGVGDWDAMVKSVIPGMPASESKCNERVRAICGGRWTWSDFSGEMMGMPFEGHALCGYEPASGKYVSYWIDSMSATHMRTTGSYDEKTRSGPSRASPSTSRVVRWPCPSATHRRTRTRAGWR